MPVAYLCSRYPAVSHTFVQREVLALRERGVDVQTFSIRRAAPGELLSETDRQEHRSTVAVLPPAAMALATAHLGAAVGAPRAYLATLARALRLAPAGLRGLVWQLFYFAEAVLVWHECDTRGIAHIHVHFANVGADVALLAAHFGARAGRGPRTWSLTLHGPAELYDVTANRLEQKARAAAFVACTSDYSRSQVMALVPREEWGKLHMVRSGAVDLSAWRAYGARDATPGSLKVLSVARLVRRKGHVLLLEAIASLQRDGVDVTAVIAGDGPERDRLGALARELGIADAVDLPGAVGQDEIRMLYEHADAFCLPSFGEGVPVVLMEAMAMELPVVATRVMGTPELVEHGVEGLLVPPGRADLLAEALARLAAEPDLRLAMGQAGRRKLVSEFDFRRSAERLDGLLRPYVPGS